MQHIIKKQIIEISLDKRLNAFRIQQQVSEYYFAKIVPLLQEAFDTASNDEETIRIDNLVIDLGMITEKEIEKGTWEEKVFKNITEQLIPVKHRIPSGVKVKKKASSLSISDQWIFYMQHGYLPWNVLQINQNWYNKALEAFASDAVAISNLRNLIDNHPDSMKRIVAQNSESFLKALVETLTAENQATLVHSINGIINNSVEDISSKNKKQYRQELWEQVVKLAASGGKNLTASKITKALSIRKINGLPKENSKKLKEATDQDKNSTIDQEEVFVSNAGIVLLHPFFKQFFKNLQLINQDGFTDSLSHQKALYLLHYLAAGNTKPEEHELVMAKILCAFPLEDPVNNLIELTGEESKEADSVLESAIGQWAILKGTSTDGLREGFLNRNGKLFTKNGHLHLQIEASSIDMLLDHLPWNLGIIKLPWMKDILKVEWR